MAYRPYDAHRYVMFVVYVPTRPRVFDVGRANDNFGYTLCRRIRNVTLRVLVYGTRDLSRHNALWTYLFFNRVLWADGEGHQVHAHRSNRRARVSPDTH